ncbi:MAG: hypothetical protein ACRD98_00555 [Nitrososphaera sp.]
MNKDIVSLRNLLTEQESIIECNKPILIDIAEALSIIKSEKLWKPDYPSFDIYCLKRWGWNKRTVFYLCSSESYQRNLENKRQKRVHTKVPPDDDHVTLVLSVRRDQARRMLEDVPSIWKVEINLISGGEYIQRIKD